MSANNFTSWKVRTSYNKWGEVLIPIIIPFTNCIIFVSLCHHRIPENISAVLLFKMLEHDDCSLIPAVKVDHFDKEVINFAKKNQLYKNVDYEGIAKNAESFNHFWLSAVLITFTVNCFVVILIVLCCSAFLAISALKMTTLSASSVSWNGSKNHGEDLIKYMNEQKIRKRSM